MDSLDSSLANPPFSPTCVFCNRASLDGILWEGEHFFLLADHAPLVAGHLLIVPHAHYACYGTVPLGLEEELIAIKRRVARFFEQAYRVPVFFEHGVFHQTVFHAHLHAFPFGCVNFGVHALMGSDGKVVRSLADVAAWYVERGHYFYLEQPRNGDQPAEAAIFPPDETVYFRVLSMLRDHAQIQGGWQPVALRRAMAGAKVRQLIDAWRAFEH